MRRESNLIRQIAEGGVPDAADPGLPIVPIPRGSTSISETGSTLGKLLAATGRYYLWGGAVVRLDNDDDDGSTLQPIKTAKLPSIFEEVCRPAKITRLPDGGEAAADTIFSEQDAKLILHADAFRLSLPAIRLLSRSPVLVRRPSGEIDQVCGYDAETGILADGEPAPEYPLHQSVELLHAMLADFEFASASDRSRALAAMITPAIVFGGLLRGGRAPVDLGEADQSQTGKGYRNKVTAAIYRTVVKTVTQRRGGGVGSLEEAFNGHLVKGASFICLDNIRGKVDSPSIESFLTEDSYTARVPYQEPIDVDPRRVVVQMTSNKADITVDLANRCSCVRLLKRGDDRSFRRFPEGDLLEHVRRNQPAYLGAVFAVVRAWAEAGYPTTPETRHDFRPWAQALDWIVQNLLRAAPLLDGHRDTQARMANPSLNWLRDVALAVRQAGRLGSELRAHDLLDMLVDQGAEGIPGVRDMDRVHEEAERTKALQAIGRKLSQCFKTDEVLIDGWSIRRHFEYDQGLRRDTKSYVFDRAAASAPMAAPNPRNIGANGPVDVAPAA